MALERKPSGAYDAAYPVNVPGGGTAYANATVAVDQNGNPVSGGGGGPVTIADGADVAEGATTAPAYTDQTGGASGTVVGILKGLYAALRGTLTVVGNVAHGTADAGAPVEIGGFASNSTPPAVGNGQRARIWVAPNGQLVAALFAQGGNALSDGASNAPTQAQAPTGTPVVGVNYTYVFNGATWDRAPGNAAGAFMVSKGSGSIATAQVSVGTGSTQIVAARAGRGSVKITNLGTNDVFIGVAGVTATTGDLLPGTKGASIVVPTNAAVFGVAAAAQSVSVMEVF